MHAERDLKEAGNLVPKMVPSLRTSALSQASLPLHSVTIGSPSRELAVSSSTGLQPGATGADVRRVLEVAAQAALNSREADANLLALLPPQLTQRIDWQWRNAMGNDGQFESRLAGCAILAGASKADVKVAEAMILAACAPAPPETAARELTRLKAMTKARATGDIDTRMQAAAYTEELARYPADVIVSACRYWSSVETWWPSWAELKDLLDFRLRKRLALARALREAIERC